MLPVGLIPLALYCLLLGAPIICLSHQAITFQDPCLSCVPATVQVVKSLSAYQFIAPISSAPWPTPMVFSCLTTCGKTYKNSGQLKTHRTKCDIYKADQERAAQMRKERAKQRDRAILQAESSRNTQASTSTSNTTIAEQNTYIPPTHVEVESMDIDRPMANIEATTSDNSGATQYPSLFFQVTTALPPPPPSPPPPPAPPATSHTGRPTRQHRLPSRFRDNLPERVPPLDQTDIPSSAAQDPTPTVRRVILIVRDRLATAANSFGLWRLYPRRPSYDPDDVVDSAELSTSRASVSTPFALPESQKPPWPFANMSIHRMMDWMHSGSSKKTPGEVNRIVHDIINQDDFKASDFDGFDAFREDARLTASENDLKGSIFSDDFQEATVQIEVPSGDRNIPPRWYSVPGLVYRPLLAVIKAVFSEPLAAHFHYFPFEVWWKSPSSGKDERVYGELYNSTAWLDEDERIQRRAPPDPQDPHCKREKVIAGIMLWSDSTHLANFGTAKMWPIYLFLGNLSKYLRGMPTSGACQHLAYIPSLPDSFGEWVSTFNKHWKTQKTAILAHCRRELMHAVWKHLLDADFLHAYTYGIVIKCVDGIERRVFPRIFTYSADYPEKVLLATIRDNGLCPCPRCLATKDSLDSLGFVHDLSRRVSRVREYLSDKVKLAREFVYKSGFGVRSMAVENVLKITSLVPTMNAFVEKLGLDFSLSRLLVVDLMHEFELGVWKTLFTHLIRILYAAGAEKVDLLNERYRLVPSFGADTIRPFRDNPSEMKKLAARNFEDLLQCAIPVFETLLPGPHNALLLILLYRMAEWHALAKLRIHTDSTLSLLQLATIDLGRCFRQFRDTTCSAYRTFELPRERDARDRQQRRKEAQAPQASSSTSNAPSTPSVSSRSEKILNLLTYKFHALGDYVSTIKLFGTTDSYSTQIGELAHRVVKRLYAATNKNNATTQIAKKYRRQQRLARAREAGKKSIRTRLAHAHQVGRDVSQTTDSSPELHHHISPSRNVSLSIIPFMQQGPRDPAKKDFLPKLKDHLLTRCYGYDFGDSEVSFSQDERNNLRIIGNKMFAAKVFRVNYTTYDVRHAYDSINPRTQANVMVLSPESGPGTHRYWYARVLGVFHTSIQHIGPKSRNHDVQRVEFLWVRWYGAEHSYRYGSKVGRLPKIGFVEGTDEYAFGFLDPAVVVRGCHLIPAFTAGRTQDLLRTDQPTAARSPGEIDDWVNYYVNIWVDRDMFMRHIGGGVGHSTTVLLAQDGHGSGSPWDTPWDGDEGGEVDEGDREEGTANQESAGPEHADTNTEVNVEAGDIEVDEENNGDEYSSDSDEESEDEEGEGDLTGSDDDDLEVSDGGEDDGYGSLS